VGVCRGACTPQRAEARGNVVKDHAYYYLHTRPAKMLLRMMLIIHGAPQRLKDKWLVAHSKRRRSLVYRKGVGSLRTKPPLGPNIRGFISLITINFTRAMPLGWHSME
jgi:hypothetical protein